jgi:hypothetical protein
MPASSIDFFVRAHEPSDDPMRTAKEIVHECITRDEHFIASIMFR